MDQQPVEQAVFTTGNNGSTRGYRIVAASAGIGETDARELAAWGPSYNSMLDPSQAGESLNFHPLPSGAHCVSRSLTLDGDNDNRQRIFTHCLIVPPETLFRFGNNPFAISRAASDRGLWLADVPAETLLAPLWLPGGAAAVDAALLARLAADPGPEDVAALVQSARDAVCLAVGGGPSPSDLFAGLFSCLPAECRLEFSFSTGLKFSPRRPFRLVALSGDPAERRWVAGYSNVAVLETHRGDAPRPGLLDGWGQFIQRALSGGQISFLAAQLSKRRFHVSLNDLPVLGLQLLEELDALKLGADQPAEAPAATAAVSARNAHAAHHRFTQGNAPALTAAAPPRRATCFDLASPELLDKLEQLDDLVYESINGRSGALNQLQTAWPKLLAELGEDLVAESREQYLRYALSIWDECSDADGFRHPDRAVHALDVLCLLFDESA